MAAGYAPPGISLVSTTLLGARPEPDGQLIEALRIELRERHGPAALEWRPLAVQRIRQALPVLSPDSGAKAGRPLCDGVWVCGDHRASASIQGAMAAGQAVAEAIAAK